MFALRIHCSSASPDNSQLWMNWKEQALNHNGNTNLKWNEHSLEVTGIGAITALLIAFGVLAGDGTLPLSQYLALFGFLAVAAAGLAWRILKHAPAYTAKTLERR